MNNEHNTKKTLNGKVESSNLKIIIPIILCDHFCIDHIFLIVKQRLKAQLFYL